MVSVPMTNLTEKELAARKAAIEARRLALEAKDCGGQPPKGEPQPRREPRILPDLGARNQD